MVRGDLVNSEMTHQGGCSCKAVRFSVVGDPVLLTICHCTFCQRATGSSHLVEPIWRESSFSIISGSPQTYDTISRGSGKRVSLYFCDVCGTKTHQKMERFSGIVGVWGGSLDNPGIAFNAKEVWRIFVDDAAPGTVIPPNVPTWHQHRIDEAGHPLEPTVFTEMQIIV